LSSRLKVFAVMSRFLRKIRDVYGSSEMPAAEKAEQHPAPKKKTDRPVHGKAAVNGTNSAAHESSIKGDSPSSSYTLSSPPTSTTNGKVDLVSLQERTVNGQKTNSKERPDENARQLASTLTLEEQVFDASFQAPFPILLSVVTTVMANP